MQLLKNQKYEFMIRSLFLSDKLNENEVRELLDDDNLIADKKLKLWKPGVNNLDILE